MGGEIVWERRPRCPQRRIMSRWTTEVGALPTTAARMANAAGGGSEDHRGEPIRSPGLHPVSCKDGRSFLSIRLCDGPSAFADPAIHARSGDCLGRHVGKPQAGGDVLDHAVRWGVSRTIGLVRGCDVRRRPRSERPPVGRNFRRRHGVTFPSPMLVCWADHGAAKTSHKTRVGVLHRSQDRTE